MCRNTVFTLIMFICCSVNVMAGTVVDGLADKLTGSYVLSLEIGGNDSKSYLLNVYPVNIVEVRYADYATAKNEEICKAQILPDEYKLIYEKAYHAIQNFKILDKSNPVSDATHYKLSLVVNEREISIRYQSVPYIKEVSAEYFDILEIINKYLPENRRLKY